MKLLSGIYVRSWVIVAISVFCVACAQTVKKPQMEVRIKPIVWQASSTGFSDADKQSLIDWLYRFPARDLFLHIDGYKTSQTRIDVKQFLYGRGLHEWQLTKENFLSDKKKPYTVTTVSGVLIQRVPAQCPNWRAPNMADSSEGRTSNFSCATQHNLMTSVSDGRDFIRGKSLSPASAEKMVKAMKAYFGRLENATSAESIEPNPTPVQSGTGTQN